MSSVVNLLSKRFIARTDVKAVQKDDIYLPVQQCPQCNRNYCEHEDKSYIPWRRVDIESHLSGTVAYGHYLLNQKDECKLFAFDIDWEKAGSRTAHISCGGAYPRPMTLDVETPGWDGEIVYFDPRVAWRDRSHEARPFMKYQLRMVAHKFVRAIVDELDIPCAVAYTGAKGVHVYGFTGLIPAVEAREGAQIVIDAIGELENTRGEHFYRFADPDPVNGFPNISIEVFPKQTTLDGKELGNLMRLPLGRNMKAPNDPTFFVDMSRGLMELSPVDPMHALTAKNPWLAPGE